MKKKILIVHGWSPASYTSAGCTDPWAHRSRFVAALSHHFEVIKVNLRGFGGSPDPSAPWTLNSYVGDVGEAIYWEKPQYVLGYSFGGAIVLRWKKLTGNTSVKAFLISPAIIRRYEHTEAGKIARSAKKILPNKLVSMLRDAYLSYWVKNPNYSHATPVMRETYRNIVAVDLRQDLIEVQDQLILIYGQNDTATPPSLVADIIRHSAMHHKLHVIRGGDHDIANTHAHELIEIIKGATQ